MNMDIFQTNTPWAFWQCQPSPAEPIWHDAILAALPILELTPPPASVDVVFEQTLGEGRFGPNRWTLKPSRRLYYMLKPFLPRGVITRLKRLNSRRAKTNFPLHWPVEDRYVRFLWEVMYQVLLRADQEEITYRRFWPSSANFAFVLTHDIENLDGQRFSGHLADLEERMGFRSSFNFVPERYPLDYGLMDELRARGFEVGVHGLNHDGKLFNSKKVFEQHAKHINEYLREFRAVGFRSPLMHRNPEWLQMLDLEYDLSFFDTDPFEPMPGGTMSIWPFFIGRFVELPYTLVQDSTLAFTLEETTPKIWLEKLSFIQQHQGMAMLNSHPDYLLQPEVLRLYQTFLQEVKEAGNYWNPLPRQVARWWRLRTQDLSSQDLPPLSNGTIYLENDCIRLY